MCDQSRQLLTIGSTVNLIIRIRLLSMTEKEFFCHTARELSL